MSIKSTFGLIIPSLIGFAVYAYPVRAQTAGNMYARQQVEDSSSIFTGGFYRNVFGQQDLILFQRSPLDDLSRRQSINKTMWLIGPGKDWIELGALKGWTAIDGSLNGTEYWEGNYYAKEDNGVYVRSFIGPRGITGEQSYGLARKSQSVSNFLWEIRVTSSTGFVNSALISHSKRAFNIMQVGIESGSGCNLFSKGTYADNLYVEAGGIKPWTERKVYNTDFNKTNSASTWSSGYGRALNRVGFRYNLVRICK